MKKVALGIGVALFFAAQAGQAATPGALKNYKKTCASCHGINGDGKGPGGKKLKTAPTDFTDAKAAAKRSDEELFEASKLGPKTKSFKVNKDMPGYGNKYNDQELKEMVQLIREFSRGK